MSEPDAAESEESPVEQVERKRQWDPLASDADVSRDLKVLIEAVRERNAREPMVLDLRGLSDAADFFLIASGDSDVHTRAIADKLIERLEERDVSPAGIEGKNAGRWILIDYIDVVVHLFLPRVREFYQIERLWGDAPRAVLE